MKFSITGKFARTVSHSIVLHTCNRVFENMHTNICRHNNLDIQAYIRAYRHNCIILYYL